MAANDNTNDYPTLRGPNGGPFISPEHNARETNRRLGAFFAKLGVVENAATVLHLVETE